ncbi:MAG: hypothetical protein JNM75_08630 [Rhodospirillales bacterium]|nr:hypothetical protein [Rhodospirillales bacterium]
MASFTTFLRIDMPTAVDAEDGGRNPPFEIEVAADGEIPFPQVILRGASGEHVIGGGAIERAPAGSDEVIYVVRVPGGLIGAGETRVQIEGCRKADWRAASGGDWIKAFRALQVNPAKPAAGAAARVGVGAAGADVTLYFGIHKHMHQPYYNTTDALYWDGEKDAIFGSRTGNYTGFIPAAVRQYAGGGLAHAGLSTSWSGSLIEQLNRCARDGLCGGSFSGWNEALQALAAEKTALGNPRCDFTAFGFFHPLMALIPARNIVKQIAWHRRIVRETFGVEASPVMFPPETAFHVRMIPALIEAGVEAVIYDSIHRFRACRDYPYAGMSEGMLPPNRAEQVDPPAHDWLQLHNIWAGSKIAPSLLRPEYVAYEDPGGRVHKMICIPAERYIGNEDARGGFGALQYGSVLGQVHDRIVADGSFDPKHPPFFLLHSDGDNHGGGADSYYHHNTAGLVRWLQEDRRFELTTVRDYLDRFPPNPDDAIHIEPGAWSGADNGDPQFMKWFSRYNEPYSPDLNSWATLTAFQNMVHSVEDAEPEHPALADAIRLMLTAETSCYWYWTGQHVWDQQVTDAANLGHAMLADAAVAGRRDATPPTVFAPWVIPENPGGQTWGNNALRDAPREGVVHTFVHDISGLKRVDLVVRTVGDGAAGERRIAMTNRGPYPTRTGAAVTADYCTADLPAGAGDIRYFVEAEDRRGNVARSALERIFLA